MDTQRRLKTIYSCSYLTTEEKLYPLQKWYNQLIDKTYDELEIPDVTRMIRQDIFTQLAIAKAIEFLNKNPFCGELYEGEILEQLFKLDTHYLLDYSEKLLSILSKTLVINRDYEWLLEEERLEYKNLIEAFFKKIS